MSRGGKTNAIRIVEGLGVAAKVLEYEVDESDLSAAAVADKIGLPLERVWKTLALRGDRSGVFLCCVPGGEELDLRKAARAAGDKSAEMLPLRELEPVTGYVRGGCSPIGLKRPLPVFVDETVELFDEVSVSAGRRGAQLLLSPADLLRAASATLADLV